MAQQKKATVTCTVVRCIVKNHRKGTVLHLGDGRKLAFGESAEVQEDVRAACIANGSGE